MSDLVAIAAAVAGAFSDRLRRVASLADELTYEVAPVHLLEVAWRLRDQPDLRFEVLIDVAGIDYLEYGCPEWKTELASATGFSRGVSRGRSAASASEPYGERVPAANQGRRFAVVYHLLSITHNARLRLRVPCADAEEPIVDSVTQIWAAANWFEREAFDLFGILFNGHPDLRRLLTDYGFIGHPFRKDFPLIGNVEVRYDPAQGRVIYEPVSIEPRVLVPKVIRHDNRYAQSLKTPKVGN